MERPLANPRRRDRRRIAVGAGLSVLVHLLLAVLFLTLEPPPDQEAKREAVRLRVLDGARSASKTPEPIRGQVVDVPKPAKEEISPDARFLSRWDTRVRRETKARRSPDGRTRTPGSPQGTTTPSPGSQAGEGTDTANLPLAQPPGGKPAGTGAPDRTGRGMKGLAGLDRMLVPSLGGGKGAARAAGLAGEGIGGQPLGGMVSSDAILGVPEEGDQTLVNTRSFKYWDFFQRVKDRVRAEWKPGEMYQARDPQGKVYGNRDRLTVLSVALDAAGEVVRLEVSRESGLTFLDEEAIRAFRQAGPFRNPPAGLVDAEGRITFTFGFLLEVGASKGRFFWQRED